MATTTTAVQISSRKKIPADPFTMESIIDKFVWVADQLSPLAFNDYKVAAGLYLVSTFAGRKFPILRRSTTKLFVKDGEGYVLPSAMFINLWMMLIGEPRISKKSTIVGITEQFIDAINPNIKLPISFTPQSAISIMDQMMHERNDGDLYVTWLNDEVSSFFSMQQASYMVMADTLLCRLYDGRPYQHMTIDRGVERVMNPYLTALTATTPTVVRMFSHHQLQGGLLARFTMVYPPRQAMIQQNLALKENVEDELLSELTHPSTDVFEIANEIKTFLYRLYNRPIPAEIMTDRKASRMLADFSLYVDGLILQLDHDDPRKGFLGHMPTIAHKAAACRRLSRLSEDELTGDYTVFTIERKDMEWAISFVQGTWNQLGELLEIMNLPYDRPTGVSDASELQDVYNQVIKLYEKNGFKPVLNRDVFASVTRYHHDRLRRILGSLVMQQRLIEVDVLYEARDGSQRKGRAYIPRKYHHDGDARNDDPSKSDYN